MPDKPGKDKSTAQIIGGLFQNAGGCGCGLVFLLFAVGFAVQAFKFIFH